MSNFLILRLHEQTADLTELLDKTGDKYYIEPIFKVKKLHSDAKIDAKIAILTSFNAISAFLSAKMVKNVKIFAISEKISKELAKNGYFNVLFPKKSNANQLEKLILSKNIAKNEKIVYFHGNFITKDFAEILRQKGHEAQSFLAYQVFYNDEFSADFLEYVKNNNFDYVLCFSQNVAQNFSELIKKHNLVDYFSKCKIIGFSDEIIAKLRNLGFENVDQINSVDILQEIYN